MSAYSELIKSFEKIRAYMREFYVYGFKSRDEYRKKSARSYDDERRRLESWLGEHMSFIRTPEGKSVFISIDSRTIRHNPLYHAWKAKSFTDGDVTLHFILFDILHDTAVRRTVTELLAEIDGYLAGFPTPMVFDESTVRKKLKEYCAAGLLIAEREGRRVLYRRSEPFDPRGLVDALHFFSEVAPCGVIGSFILDKVEADTDAFTFKHHYITGAIDSGVLAALFDAMREERAVTVSNLGHRRALPSRVRIVPLRVFISVQSGRQNLIAYLPELDVFQSYRLDHLSAVKQEERCERFAELRAELDRRQAHMWGVGLRGSTREAERLEHVAFTVRVEEGEEHILRRLERERRCGRVERIDGTTYRFSADVYDTSEIIPWIGSFIGRITGVEFSNRNVKERFLADLRTMYRNYGIEGVDE